MDAGAERYQFASIDVEALVRRVAGDFEPCAREGGKRIEVTNPGGLTVWGDESALRMALGNLIENAIKYSPGEPSIRASWEARGTRVAISVMDRGIGIPRADHRAIFGKFTRGRAAITAGIGGTGIGLALVREIAQGHGAEVIVESEPDRGARSRCCSALDRRAPC